MPHSGDYSTALQSLATTILDAELRAGEVAVSALGLPQVRSGNFSNVFQVRCSATNSVWAVKCYTQLSHDLKERYAAIAAHLQQTRLPFISPFQWIEPGIRIGAESFPVLKMQWVNGETLDQFIAKRLDQPQLLCQLAGLWVKASNRLREAGIAHGDLNHENIVLMPDARSGRFSLRLIDYDGMYVPALAGRPPAEFGHAAFQHPARVTEDVFGPEMDRFSHLVIYASLRAVASRGRSLWERYYTGEGLIFAASDFLRPEQSAVLGELWRDADASVRELAGHLFVAARGTLGEVPALETLIDGDNVVPLSTAQRRMVQEALVGGGAGSYRADISTANPAAILVIVDQSASMSESLAPTARSKSEFAADIVNRLLARLVIRCAKGEGCRDYFHIGVIVYGDSAQFILPGPKAGRQLVPIGELASQPLRIETRDLLQPDGAGGVISAKVREPIWLEAGAHGASAACAAFDLANQALARFVAEHPAAFPPIVFMIADGAASDGDLTIHADRLKDTATRDGPALLLTTYLSIDPDAPVRFPKSDRGLPAEARPFYFLASLIPASLAEEGGQLGHSFSDTTRAFAFNADLIDVIDMLPLGTRSRRGTMGDSITPRDSRHLAERQPAATEPAAATAGRPPLVFISAKSEDYDHARSYFAFLTKRGMRVFLSCESLPELGTSDYREAIDEALDEARHMVVVTSSAENVRSSWVKAEWGLFINEKRSDRKVGSNIVTVIVGSMSIAALPASLRYYEVIADGPAAFEKVYSYVAR